MTTWRKDSLTARILTRKSNTTRKCLSFNHNFTQHVSNRASKRGIGLGERCSANSAQVPAV